MCHSILGSLWDCPKAWERRGLSGAPRGCARQGPMSNSRLCPVEWAGGEGKRIALLRSAPAPDTR